MHRLGKLIIIGIISASTLAFVMYLFNIITGSKAYILLYNVDYIPLLKHFENSFTFGIIFHFVFCIISVIGLFYLLSFLHLENYILPYIIVYGSGAAALYFLSFLTTKPSAPTDELSWLYWTISHIIYGLVVGLFIKYWLRKSSF